MGPFRSQCYILVDPPKTGGTIFVNMSIVFIILELYEYIYIYMYMYIVKVTSPYIRIDLTKTPVVGHVILL